MQNKCRISIMADRVYVSEIADVIKYGYFISRFLTKWWINGVK